MVSANGSPWRPPASTPALSRLGTLAPRRWFSHQLAGLWGTHRKVGGHWAEGSVRANSLARATREGPCDLDLGLSLSVARPGTQQVQRAPDPASPGQSHGAAIGRAHAVGHAGTTKALVLNQRDRSSSDAITDSPSHCPSPTAPPCLLGPVQQAEGLPGGGAGL